MTKTKKTPFQKQYTQKNVGSPTSSAINADRLASAENSEIFRLVNNALMHVKQGYYTHALDYLVTVKKIGYEDERIDKLVEILDEANNKQKGSDLENIWHKSVQLFPEITHDIDLEQHLEQKTILREAARLAKRLAYNTSPVMVGIALLGCLALLLLGISFSRWGRHSHLFQRPVQVRTQSLIAQGVPIYYIGSANRLQPKVDVWHAFSTSGQLKKILVKLQDKVQPGEPLALLKGSEKQESLLAIQYKKLEYIKNKLTSDDNKVIILDKYFQDINSKITYVVQQLKIMQSGIGLKKKEVSKMKKIYKLLKYRLNKINFSIHQNNQDIRNLRSQEQNIQNTISRLMDSFGSNVLKSTVSGRVTEIQYPAQDRIFIDVPLIRVVNDQVMQASFQIKEILESQKGSESKVSIAYGIPELASIVDVKYVGRLREVVVEMNNEDHHFNNVLPQGLRLLRKVATPAFSVPSKSLFMQEGRKASIGLCVEHRFQIHSMDVIEQEGSNTIIYDVAQQVKPDMALVTERLDGKPLYLLSNSDLLNCLE